MKTRARVVIGVGCLFFAVAAEPALPLGDGLGQLRARLEEAVTNGEVPGAVVLVVSDDEIVFEEAFGYADIENGRRQKTNDIFYLASSSKPLAMSAIMTFVDQGKLALDEPASKWIPEWKQARTRDDRAVRSPTIRELMSHESGMFGTSSPDLHRLLPSATGDRSLAEAVEEMVAVPLQNPPDEAFEYGGASMCVAARITELIGKDDFDRICEQRLFGRLQMSHTFYRTERDLEQRLAIIYGKGPEAFVRSARSILPGLGVPVRPPGSILSTAQDLARFLRLHLQEGVLEGKRILSRDAVLEMRRKQTEDKETTFAGPRSGGSSAGIGSVAGYGLGWMLDEVGPDGVANVFSHGGAFGTFLWGDVEARLGVVLLTQIRLPEAARLWNDVIPIIRATWGAP